jgi:hypothetical protein
MTPSPLPKQSPTTPGQNLDSNTPSTQSGKRLERAVRALQTKSRNLVGSRASPIPPATPKAPLVPPISAEEQRRMDLEADMEDRRTELKEYMREPCAAKGTEASLGEVLAWWKVRILFIAV